MTRLQTLRNRKEKLINANQIHRYTQSNSPKVEKYYRVLIAVRKKINAIECVNVRPAKSLVGMNVKQLFKFKKQ